MTSFAQLSQNDKAQLWACLALRYADGIGARRAKSLVEHYETPLAAVEAGRKSASTWMATRLVSEKSARAFSAEKWREAAQQEWQAVQKSGCSVLLWTSSEYPALLREVSDAPLLLYYQGDTSLLHNPSIGIVGARACTRDGMAVSAFFARGLSQAGVTVISGLAKGIDRVAHLAGLEGAGSSIAVLGTGIDVIYPSENADLAEAVAARGLIISEFGPGTPALPRHFPVRNRIISGLSRGVLVVEAAGRSGSLITARLALEQNRDVFAVPGRTTAATSEGCHELIRRGAKPVFNADDILNELAPLLHQDALAALEKRRIQPRSTVPHHAPDRHKALTTEIQGNGPDCDALFFDGTLPWCASTKSVSRKSAVRPGRVAHATVKNPLSAVDANCPTRAMADGCVDSLAVEAPAVSVAPCAAFLALPLSSDEERIVAALDSSRIHIDALARALSMEISPLSSALLVLEMRGAACRHPGMCYSLPE